MDKKNLAKRYFLLLCLALSLALLGGCGITAHNSTTMCFWLVCGQSK